MVLIILWISALQTVYEYIVAHLYSPVEGCCLQVKYYMKSEMEVPPWRLIVHELFSSKAIAGHKTKWSVKVQSFKKTILWNQLTVIFNFKSFQYKIKSVTTIQWHWWQSRFLLIYLQFVSRKDSNFDLKRLVDFHSQTVGDKREKPWHTIDLNVEKCSVCCDITLLHKHVLN